MVDINLPFNMKNATCRIIANNINVMIIFCLTFSFAVLHIKMMYHRMVSPISNTRGKTRDIPNVSEEIE